MKRRGMSQIITTVIMIGIVLVAIGAVWVVAQNILSQGLEDVSLGSLKVNLDIENVKMTDTGLDVKVKRNSGEANLVRINFIVSDGENTEIFEEETDMKELATQTFTLDYDGLIQSVEIAPVLANENGKEKVYDSVDVEELSVEQSLESLGAVSWWKMDGDAKDEIGENNGELIGDTDCSVGGVYGKACEFDGSGDYIEVAASDSLDLKNSFTLAVWISPTSLDSSRRGGIIVKRFSNINTPYYLTTEGAGMELGYTNSTSWNILDVVNSLVEDEWCYIVYTKQEGKLKFYKNGELIKETSSYGEGVTTQENLFIGREAYGTPQYFSGYMDNIMIFNKALTEDEVEWLYEQDLS